MNDTREEFSLQIGVDFNVSGSKPKITAQLNQLAQELSSKQSFQIIGSLNTNQTQKVIQSQLSAISKNLKVEIGVDSNSIKKQADIINREVASGIKGQGVKIPFQFDLSDANAVKSEINKIVSDITNNRGKLVKYKINVDDDGKATKALLTYRNELDEVTNATLKLQNVGKWYDANGIEHHIVKWTEAQKSLSQNIEATTRANLKQVEADKQVINRKADSKR